MARASLGMPEFPYLSRYRHRAPAEKEHVIASLSQQTRYERSSLMHPRVRALPVLAYLILTVVLGSTRYYQWL